MYNKFIYILFSLIIFSSCKKEGCIDILATNYDVNADTDNGSCMYQGCLDPLSINYNPTSPNPVLDTACLSFNKTWIADSYIVNGVQYITSTSVTLEYIASSPTEGSYQISGIDHDGDPIDEDGTYSYDLDNLNMSHTTDGSTYSLSVDKFTNNELDLSGGEIGFSISLNLYSI